MLSVSPASAQYVIDNGDLEIVDGSGDGTSGDHDSPWNVPQLNVNDDGKLIIQNGGQVESTISIMKGEVEIIGQESKWTNQHYIEVGSSLGPSSIIVEDGALLDTEHLFISFNDVGSEGLVKVTGSESKVTADAWIIISGSGQGELIVADGGMVTTGTVQLVTRTDSPTSEGVLRLEGGVNGHGTLQTGQLERGGGGAALVNFNGGTLRLTGDQNEIFSGFRDGEVVFAAGGGWIDTGGYNVATGLGFVGAGELTVTGNGTLTLTGDSRDYTGDVGIDSDATLRLASGSVLGTSGLSIDPDATLAGSGQVIGDVTAYSGGIIAPGMDTLGTLTVNGNVLFHEGSILAVRIASNGDSDALTVNGEASLAGNVEVTALDPRTSYVDGHRYATPILSATGGRNGTEFADVGMASGSAFITPTLSYEGNDVFLTIAVTQDFTTVAQTFNQLQASDALNHLEQTGDALTVFNTIANMDEDNAHRAFDLTSGEIHASGQHVIDQTFGLFNRTLRQQAGAGTGGSSSGGQVFTAPLAYGPTMGVAGVAAIDDATTSAYADQRIAQAWLAPLGGRGTIDGDGNAATLDWWSAGIAGGYEGQIDLGTGNGFAGFGMGYIRSHGSVDARLSSFDADGFYIGTYGAWEEGPWQLAGSLAYAANRISTERNIVFGGLNRTAEADYWTHSFGFSGEAAYGMDMGGGTTFLPLFTLDAGWSGHGGFTETGAGALNVSAGSESWTRLDTGIGLGISHVAPTETGRLVLEGRAVWEHAFADVVPSQSLSFAGGPVGFDVRGPAASRDRLRVGAGLAWDVAPDMTVRANYDGLFSSDQSSHSGSIGLNIRF